MTQPTDRYVHTSWDVIQECRREYVCRCVYSRNSISDRDSTQEVRPVLQEAHPVV